MAKRDFIEVMKEVMSAIAPGLENIGPEIGAELSRLGTQGAMEMAQALFNGAAFTPYGPGQYTPTPELDQGSHEQAVQKAETQLEQAQDRGGRREERLPHVVFHHGRRAERRIPHAQGGDGRGRCRLAIETPESPG